MFRLALACVVATIGLMLPETAYCQAKLNPPLVIPNGVEMKKDVVYGRGDNRDLKMDLFLPPGDGPFPAVVYIHGGGWRGGNRSAFHRQAAMMAARGFVGACIEYRLSGEASFPAAVEDCKCTVRMLRANFRMFKIDPERIAVAGGSAGGHLAALLGVTPDRKDLEGTGGHAGQSSRVQAVVAFNGVFDFEPIAKVAKPNPSVVAFLGGSFEDRADTYRLASPATHVAKGAPPFLFLHGTADTTVPIDQSRQMAQTLKAIGAVAETYEAPGAGHGFFNRPPHFEPTFKRMAEFLGTHLGKK
jgi:acetyl esterase/lipase